MRTTFAMKFTGALLTVAGCALLAGCARPSTVSSQGFIVNAGYAIRAAEERKAADHAPNELNDARTKLVEAEKSFSANQMDRATRLAQQAARTQRGKYSFIEMGGRGAVEDQDTLAQEVSLRGFWQYYRKAVGFNGAGTPL